MVRVILILLMLFVAGLAAAAEYECKVTRKIDSERTYTADQLEKGQFSVKVAKSNGATLISRCSFSVSANEVTCDGYKVDKVEFDKSAKMKKYYVFRSQFDVQLFSDLVFVENNGRGGIPYGKCQVVAP